MNRNDFIFRTRTKVIFGFDSAARIGSICKENGFHRVFVITDKNVEQLDVMKTVLSSLKAEAIEYGFSNEVEREPHSDSIDYIAALVKDYGPDAVVAVGGGSTIDTAKAVCTLQTNEGSSKEYIFGAEKSVGRPGIPSVVIPTTSGSGSEVTPAAVLSDEVQQKKASISCDWQMPTVAIIDPKASIDMPKDVTAATGMDALTHAIESYTATSATPFSDALAIEAIRMIGANIMKAYEDPGDMEARANMAIASTMAGMSFANGGLGAVHGIAQAIGGVSFVSHGVANSVMLPYVMRKNYVGNLKKFGQIAAALGGDITGLTEKQAAEKSVEIVEKLARDLGIPATLRELGIKKEMFPKIIEETMAYRLLSVNPVTLTEEDIEVILRESY